MSFDFEDIDLIGFAFFDDLFADQVQQSFDQVQQSSDQVQQSSDQVQQSSDQVQQSSDQVQQSSDQVQQSSDQVQQSFESSDQVQQSFESSDQVQQPVFVLDWLSFTVDVSDSFEFYVLFGDTVVPRSSGFRGYDRSASLPEGGVVAWGSEHTRSKSGSDTVHFSLPGRCCGWLRARHVDLVGVVRRVLEVGGHFTRLDVAFDDRSGLFSVADFASAVDAGCVLSRWRSWQHVGGLRGTPGATVYGGSRGSDSFLRVYDKIAERQVKEGEDIGGSWLRVEFVTRRRVSSALARVLIESGIGGVAAVFRSYCDWRVPSGDSNSSRWPVDSRWLALFGSDRFVLHVDQPRSTFFSAVEWAERSWPGTLSAVAATLGDNLFGSWLHHVLDVGVAAGERKMEQWGVISGQGWPVEGDSTPV